MSGAFVDLRLNSHAGQSNEGFWPSFTDIMTVVVMIFMMAMLLLLLKNMHLVHQLQATLAAEHTASKQASNATSKNADLRSQLQRAERALGMLQMQLMNMSDERDRLSSALTRITSAQKGMASRFAANQEQLALKRTQYAELETELNRNREALTLMHKNKARVSQRLASLTNEYTTLKFRYNKLVRPARTAKGKYVVMIRVSKVNGRVRTELKTPGIAGFSAINRVRLNQKLGHFRQQHPHDMYVKIIFPEDSGLSYSEAWNLTESLLRKYDYYYHSIQ